MALVVSTLLFCLLAVIGARCDGDSTRLAKDGIHRKIALGRVEEFEREFEVSEPSHTDDHQRVPWKAWELPQQLLKHFPTEASAKLDPNRFELQIKLLTFDRMGPALRFLKSMEQADYLGDRVNLEIFLDHPYNGVEGWRSMSSEEQAEAMRTRESMLTMLDNFTWSHGSKTIHSRELNSGIQPQWMEAWWPEHVNQFAFIAEDDTQLSPFFYMYLKRLVMFYYYNQDNFDSSIYGISLQRNTFVPGKKGNSMTPPGEPFLYPLIGTWGQMVFPILWKEYRQWYDQNRFVPGREPIIGNMVTTDFWTNKGNAIWTPWQIQWAYVRHVYNIYPAFPGKLALSVSHRTSGVNYKKTMGPDADLITRDTLPSIQLPSEGEGNGPPGTPPDWWTVMPPAGNIKKFDFCFRRIPNLRKPLRSMAELQAHLPEFGAEEELVVLPAPATDASYRLIRNWLCTLDGLNLHNYLILFSEIPLPSGEVSSEDANLKECVSDVWAASWKQGQLADDLASRGHLVFIAPAEREFSAELDCTEDAFKNRRESLFNIQQAKAVQGILDLGASVLVTSLGSLWRANPFTCIAASGEVEDVTLWTRPRFSDSNIASFALWLKSSSKGRGVLNLMLSQWKSHGTEDVRALSGEELSSFRREFNVVDSSNLGVGMGRCISAVYTDAVANGAPAFVLQGGSEKELRSKGSWLIDDLFSACKSVTCKR